MGTLSDLASARQSMGAIRDSVEHLQEDQSRPSIGGGGGSGVSFKDYVDAQDEKTRAQNDARFAEVLAEIRSLPKPPTIWQIIGVVAGGIGLVFAILAFSADRFDGGIAASGLLDELRTRQVERDATQDEKLDAILRAVTAD